MLRNAPWLVAIALLLMGCDGAVLLRPPSVLHAPLMNATPVASPRAIAATVPPPVTMRGGQRAPLTAGATVMLHNGPNGRTYTLHGVEQNATSTCHGGCLSLKPGLEAYVLHLTMTNTGQRDTVGGFLDEAAWKARTTDGYEYDGAIVMGYGDLVDNSDLSPGARSDGVVVIGLPPGARVQWVRVGLSATSAATGTDAVYAFFDAP